MLRRGMTVCQSRHPREQRTLSVWPSPSAVLAMRIPSRPNSTRSLVLDARALYQRGRRSLRHSRQLTGHRACQHVAVGLERPGGRDLPRLDVATHVKLNALLLNEDGTLTARGQTILDHTPARRFGDPDDLMGAIIYLCSPAARFVTGTIMMVDGGVNAFSGI